MAHLLQGLIALAVFSHRTHLDLKLDCVRCHAAGNVRPQQTGCRTCHDRDMEIKPRSERLVTRFSHAIHSKLGNVAPVIAAAVDRKTYHLSTTGSPPPPALRAQLNTRDACQACHRGVTGFPAMQDCLVCHPKIDPPFSCEYCHTPGPHLKPADHTPYYVDIHSTGRANLNKPACVVCHARRFTCLGCHS